MKRLWICGIALLSTAVLMGSVDAQSNARMGSYQSILAQAGLQGNGGFVPTQGSFDTGAGAFNGGAYGGGFVPGNSVYGGGSGTVQVPGAIQGGFVNGGMPGAVIQGPPASSFTPGTIVGPTVPQGVATPGTIQGTVEGGSTTRSTPPADATATTVPAAAGTGTVIDSSIGQYNNSVTPGAISGPVFTDAGMTGLNTSPVYVPGQFQAAPQFADEPQFVAAPQVSAAAFVAAPQVISAPQGRSKNCVFGISGLIFDRDFEDDVYISPNAAGDQLFSTDADTGNLSGVEAFFQSRNAGGTGIEGRYWGLFNGAASASLGNSPRLGIPGLAEVIDPTSGMGYYGIAMNADVHTITRSNEIHNIEFNFLKNMGVHTGRCASSTNELFAGFRWFNFDEGFSFLSSTAGGTPESIRYDIDVENTLLGLQAGGRSEMGLSQRLRFAAGLKGGLFNNHVRARQGLQNNLGVYGLVNGNQNFDFDDSKNDVAFLGELDASLLMQISSSARARIGYRAIGVSGVALAPNQIPLSFSNLPTVRDVDSNGSLLLHGAYLGLEFCR